MPSPNDSPPRTPARPRRALVAVVGACCLAVVAAVAAVGHQPAFYRSRSAARNAAGAADEVEQRSRRLVTKAAALHGRFVQPGPWDAAISEEELNAWLAIDLPRNHPQLVPGWLAGPRVEILSKRIRVAARAGFAGLSAVAWCDAEVALRDVNQLGITLMDARLGGLPLPRGPILREIARRLGSLGMVCDIRRLEGRTVLVVFVPSTHDAGGLSHWLEALSLGQGEVLVAGVTRRGAEVARPAAP